MNRYAKIAVVVLIALAFCWGCSGTGGSAGSFPPTTPGGGGGPGTSPVVQLITPSPCERINGNLVVRISASDDVGITVVYVLLNNVVKALFTNAPYSVTIAPVDLPADESYSIQAVAFDASGNSGSDSAEIRLDNSPPFTPNLLVVDSDADPLGLGGPYGAVFRVNTGTGHVCALASSTLFTDPVGIALDPAGDIIISDRTSDLNGASPGTGALFFVNPDRENSVQPFLTGAQFRSPAGVAEPAQTIYLVDSDANPNGLPVTNPGAIFMVNPITGAVSTLVSDARFVTPVNELLMSATEMWIVDADADLTPGMTRGAVFQLDPVSGTLVLAAASGSFTNPFDVVSDGAGGLILTDYGDFASGNPGEIFRIDTTGAPLFPVASYRTGPPFASPMGIIQSAAGIYLIADRDADENGRGAIIEVDPATPEATLKYTSNLFVNPTDLVESWR